MCLVGLAVLAGPQSPCLFLAFCHRVPFGKAGKPFGNLYFR